MPLPSLIKASELRSGMTTYTLLKDKGFKKEDTLAERIAPISCQGLHFRTKDNRQVCYWHSAEVWAAFPGARIRINYAEAK